MINAKDVLRRNAGLKGRELRQTARRMVAGIEPEQTYQSEQRSPGLAAMPSIVDNNALATNGGLVGSAPIKGPKFDFDSEVRKIKRDKK